MCNNWLEIIEITKLVIKHDRNREELKSAITIALRLLGWRITSRAIQTDFVTTSGKKIDFVLGENRPDGSYHAILPIYVQYNQFRDDDSSNLVTKMMSDINVRIAILAGTSFELFFWDEFSHKAVCVGQASFIDGDKTGEKLSSLLSLSEFNETSLIDFWTSLYKEHISAMKLNAILHSIAEDKSKAKDVLRRFLESEGFEQSIVEEALCNVDINIFYNTSAQSAPYSRHNSTDTQQNGTKRDTTRFSLNGGPFLTKRHFVLSVVSQYIKDNPLVTLNDLESRFPSAIAGEARGVVRAWSQVKLLARQNGPDIINRYFSKGNERITLHDGTEIVVNNQWRTENFPDFLVIAKQLYAVKSNAPYDGVEYCKRACVKREGRLKRFKFSMVGIKIGEMIVFDATNTDVKVVSDDSVEYHGTTYKLSEFVRTYLPENMRIPSDSYRGPNYFSYKGKTLTSMRDDVNKRQALTQHPEKSGNKKNDGIHISLNSFNTFKTNK